MGPPSVLSAKIMGKNMNMVNSKKNNKRVIFGGQTVEIRFNDKGMVVRATRGANIVPASHIKEFTDAATRLQDNELRNSVRTAQAVYELYKQIGTDIKSLLTDPQTLADIAKIGEALKAIKAQGYVVQEYDPANDFEDVH